MADDANTFVLLNEQVAGDVLSPELGGYTDIVAQTVVLRSTADAYAEIPEGPNSTYELEWSENCVVSWNTCPIEPFMSGEYPVTFSVRGALVYATCFEDKLYEFISELELSSREGEWRLRPSGTEFTLARFDPTA